MTVKHSLIISTLLILFTCIVSSRELLASKFGQNKVSSNTLWQQISEADRELFNKIYDDVKKKIALEFGDNTEDKDIIRGKNGEIIKIAGSYFSQGSDTGLPIFNTTTSTNLTKPPFSTPTVSANTIAISTQKVSTTNLPTATTTPNQTSTPASVASSNLGTSTANIEATPIPTIEVAPTLAPVPTAAPFVVKIKRVAQGGPKATSIPAPKPVEKKAEKPAEPKQEVKVEQKPENKPQEQAKQDQKQEKPEEKEHKKDK